MTPQQQEIERLTARYMKFVGDPDFIANIKILHTALADRMLNSGDVLMQLPPDMLGETETP